MEMKLTVQAVTEGLGGASVAQITDYAYVTQKVEIMTQRLDSPGKMTFVCLEEGMAAIPEGSAVEYSVDGIKMFKGYVMAIERTKDGETTYTAYDQLRYLKANASYAFENMSLSQMIQQIASDFGLVTGKLADTGYVFPCLIKENEGCLDIIFDALTQTIIQTGKIFLFYDDAGALTLAEAKDLLGYTMVGDNSLATNYTYKRSIDADTYNRVKLVKKNEETGRTDTYIYEDTDNIKKWGLLQYYDEVDKNLNDAQVDEMCSLYLKYYNRVLQTLTIEAVGVTSIRAGSIIPVQIAGIDGLASSRLLLAEKVTHCFDGDNHTMSIEVKSFEQLGVRILSELIGVIQQIVQNVVQAMKLTDNATGTVLSVDPLSIQVDINMPPLPAAAILLTDAVKEQVAPVQGGEGGTVIVSESLKPGDKVLMLRVQHGQQYIVLSRIT